ncbi:MAG: class I SAM-dependent methyltransferase [bacterium]
MDIDKHKKQFGNQAENYTKYRKPYTEKLYELLFSLAPGKKILDIACGTGKSTEPMVRSGTEVIGCDHDPLMIAEAIKQAEIKSSPIKYIVADVEHLPFEDSNFDVVTVGTAFHWFVNEKSVTEIKRVLKEKGLFFIFWTLTTKDVPEEDSIPGSFYKTFNWDKVPPELRNLDYISNFFKEQGFQNVNTARIPFSHNDTVEEQVGLMKTASSYEILSDSEKERFIRELTELLTTKLGNRPYFTYEEEIQVCYGFKK